MKSNTEDQSQEDDGFASVGESPMECLQVTMSGVLSKVLDGSMPLDRAKVANEIFRSMLTSAKVELDFFVATKTRPHKAFCMPVASVQQKMLPGGSVTRVAEGNGITSIVHQLGG